MRVKEAVPKLIGWREHTGIADRDHFDRFGAFGEGNVLGQADGLCLVIEEDGRLGHCGCLWYIRIAYILLCGSVYVKGIYVTWRMSYDGPPPPARGAMTVWIGD